jgi:hypothetical protein
MAANPPFSDAVQTNSLTVWPLPTLESFTACDDGSRDVNMEQCSDAFEPRTSCVHSRAVSLAQLLVRWRCPQ